MTSPTKSPHTTSVGQLQEYTFWAKYSRWNGKEKRRETWGEAVTRMFDMHRARFPAFAQDPLFADAEGAVASKLVLGSQRALQFGGPAIEGVGADGQRIGKNARMYNCSVSYCDRPRFFQESLWMLLCGAGVGFSVQTHHVAKLPKIAHPDPATPIVHRVSDTIEGWADALGALLSSYFVADRPFPEYAGKTVRFDFSAIRAAGSIIRSSGGKAPGPEPLRRSLECVRRVLDERLVDVGSPCDLRPIDAYDIVMHASDAVLAGGVRRSATICLFSHGDDVMMKAKTGNWFKENPQRGRSNNSVLLLRDKTSEDQFLDIIRSTKEFGEPGFVWADSTELIVNPCAEIGMYPVDTETGASGWQVCNLCEINAKACVDADAFMRACRAAAVLGTMQAAYTDFPYLGAVSERIIRREALLGCSMTGMMDNPKIAFDPELQRRGAAEILRVNTEVAAKLGIHPSARVTCVKPAGTTSCVLGTSSGIHAHHAKRYLRRVQANKREAVYAYFKAHNPVAVENSVWNPNGTDAVITFCIEAGDEALTRCDVDAIALLERVRVTQENWVAAGRRPELCTAPWLTHNVSNTVTVRRDEWEKVGRYIYAHRGAFCGVSLLGESGDLDYPQAPFCQVWTNAEIVAEYGDGALFASGLIVDMLKAFENNLWDACDAAMGIGEPLNMPSIGADPDAEQIAKVQRLLGKKDIVRRARKFAQRYFGGDTRLMTWCLKRIQILKQWCDVSREATPVDYTLMVEDVDGTAAVTAEPACAGGSCEMR